MAQEIKTPKFEVLQRLVDNTSNQQSTQQEESQAENYDIAYPLAVRLSAKPSDHSLTIEIADTLLDLTVRYGSVIQIRRVIPKLSTKADIYPYRPEAILYQNVTDVTPQDITTVWWIVLDTTHTETLRLPNGPVVNIKGFRIQYIEPSVMGPDMLTAIDMQYTGNSSCQY